MREKVVLFGVAVLGACSPPHRFFVEGANGAEYATLTLRNETSKMKHTNDVFLAERDIGDASGAIRIYYPDGRRIDCTIGYITNGEAEPHRFRITKGKCRAVGL